MEPQDYYQILGVPKDVNPKQLRETYRRLALRYHPDRNMGDPGAVEKMKRINEAYAVLSNTEKRKEYDDLNRRFGPSAHQQFRSSYSEQDLFRDSDIDQIFEGMAQAFGFRSFGELFKEYYGPNSRSFTFKKPGFYAEFREINAPQRKNGSRHASMAERGFRRIVQFALQKTLGIKLPAKGADRHDIISLHPEMAQQGGDFLYYHRRRAAKLVVKIPPGIKEGQRIRLAGMGEKGNAGGSDGDLYLKVRIQEPLSLGFEPFVRRLELFLKRPLLRKIIERIRSLTR